MRKWRYSSIILNLGTRWRWLVSFMPLPLYPWGYNHQYPMDRKSGGPQSWSGCCGGKSLASARNWTRHPPHSLVTILTELWRFSNYNFTKLYWYVSLQWSCDVDIILHYILWCHYLWTNSHLLKRIMYLHWFTGKLWELEKRMSFWIFH
jgi:hypothetical protein